jgi:hypothetical protein
MKMDRAGPDEDPIRSVFDDLAARIEAIASQPEGRPTVSALVEAIGDRSYAILLLLLAVLNLLPGPPGYGTILGAVIMALALAMIMGWQVRFWPILGDRGVPGKLLRAMQVLLDKVAHIIGKISEPRLPYLCGPRSTPFIGMAIFFLGIVMLCPIPFTNTLPSWAVVAFCVGMLNRDGLAVIAGIVIGIIGTVAMIAAVWGTYVLATLVVDVLD